MRPAPSWSICQEEGSLNLKTEHLLNDTFKDVTLGIFKIIDSISILKNDRHMFYIFLDCYNSSWWVVLEKRES